MHFQFGFRVSIQHCLDCYPLFPCSPLLAWKHLREIKLFMVSGQIAINTGCQRCVTLTSRAQAALSCGLEKDIACLNIALLFEK